MGLEQPSELHRLSVAHEELDGEYGDKVSDEGRHNLARLRQWGNSRLIVGQIGGENVEGLGWQKGQDRVCNVHHRSKLRRVADFRLGNKVRVVWGNFNERV